MLGPVGNLGTPQQGAQLPVTSPSIRGTVRHNNSNNNNRTPPTANSLSPMGSMVSPSTGSRLQLPHTDNHINSSPLRLLRYHTDNHRRANTVNHSQRQQTNTHNSLQQVLTDSNHLEANIRHLTRICNSSHLLLLMDNHQQIRTGKLLRLRMVKRRLLQTIMDSNLLQVNTVNSQSKRNRSLSPRLLLMASNQHHPHMANR